MVLLVRFGFGEGENLNRTKSTIRFQVHRFKNLNWTKSTVKFRFADIHKLDLNQKSKSRECKHEASKGIHVERDAFVLARARWRLCGRICARGRVPFHIKYSSLRPSL